MAQTINITVLGICVLGFFSIFNSSVKAEPISFSDLLQRTLPVATQHIAYGDAPDQFGDLWLPEGPGTHPVLVMIHGGCWLESLPGVMLMSYIAEDMRKAGIAVWNIEYRRLGADGAGYPDTFLDIANGIDYLRQLSGPYKLDILHVVVLGHSAGGHLALWAAARSHIDSASEVYTATPLPIAAAITLAGINDLKAYRDSGIGACGGPTTIDRLINSEGRDGKNPYSDTSPAAMLPVGVTQLIVSGTLDPIVPARFGTDYGARAKIAGDKVSVLEISNTGHFELIDPTSDAWAEIKPRILAMLHAK